MPTVKAGTAGMQGADINTVLSDSQCGALKAAGLDFVLRYAPRQLDTFRYNLTNPEMLRVLNAGLALMVVQHVSPDNWEPTAELGKAYGEYFAQYCQKTVRLPTGISGWLDLEMVKPGTPIADIIEYCIEWYNAVSAAGYIPGLYVGYQAGLTPDELYSKLPFKAYWKAYNYDDGVSTRGFTMIQHTQKEIAGIMVDPDTIQTDILGGLPFLLHQ
jgi:Domain of unknown function (DUF1906)